MNHTAKLAISTNALIEDDAGQRQAALIAPVIVLSLWFPGWVLGVLPAARCLLTTIRHQAEHLLFWCVVVWLLFSCLTRSTNA